MNYYLCRHPSGDETRAVTLSIAAGWSVFMIVETPQDPIPHWMYQMTDGTMYYLQKTSKWEYDLMVAFDIPILPSDTIFYYADGWGAKDIIRQMRDKLSC